MSNDVTLAGALFLGALVSIAVMPVALWFVVSVVW